MDDEGAFSVLEAVLALLLVAGAIFFVSLSEGGIEVEQQGAQTELQDLAGDVLAALTATGMTDLQRAVTLAFNGDEEGARDLVEPYVPADVQFTLKLDNGVRPLLLISGPTLDIGLRDAGSAHVFMVPSWIGTNSTNLTLRPGQEIPGCVSGASLVMLRNAGGNLGKPPHADEWNSPVGGAGNLTVPRDAPFGNWECQIAKQGPIPAKTIEFVAAPGGLPFAKYGPIGIQLQFWWLA